MRRFLAILLLALLPLQFSWAAVASYCGHEAQAKVEHFGHHEHQHHAGSVGHADIDPGVGSDADGDKPSRAMDLDCGQCHGFCGVMVILPAPMPGAPGTAAPSATVDVAGGAHAPTRPERPQWRPLA